MKDLLRQALWWWGRSGFQYSRFYHAMEQLGSYCHPGFPLYARLPSGATLECDIRDHVQRQIYFQGAYEPIESYLFCRLARPGSIVLDAGANIGQYTLLASHAVGVTGNVHAFEPVPTNYTRLVRHMDLNRAANVRLNPVALWHEETELQFGVPPGDGPNNGSYSAGAAMRSMAPVVTASAIRFDDYSKLNSVPRVDLIKMDIEGAELPALRGMCEILDRDHPPLLMEVNRRACHLMGYDPLELWDLLVRRLQYTPWKIGHASSDWMQLPDPTNVLQANVLFVKGNLPAEVRHDWNLSRCLRWARRAVTHTPMFGSA